MRLLQTACVLFSAALVVASRSRIEGREHIEGDENALKRRALGAAKNIRRRLDGHDEKCPPKKLTYEELEARVAELETMLSESVSMSEATQMQIDVMVENFARNGECITGGFVPWRSPQLQHMLSFSVSHNHSC